MDRADAVRAVETESVWSSGKVVAGKYRLLRPVGAGGMGQVWAATNEATDREVALKVLLSSEAGMRARLIREARAYGRIQQRNVIEILDMVDTESGDPVLVMPLLRGETLAQCIRTKGAIEPAEAVRIASDVARALTAAHARSIVHRDLKPANIFLVDDPNQAVPLVVVLDFGVAKDLTHSGVGLTAEGGIIGSVRYMSPEQVSGRVIDHRSDIWSLGVVLFEMLRGTRPFHGDTIDVMAQICGGAIPKLAALMPEVGRDLSQIVSHCLCRDREARIGSAADLAVRLDRLIEAPRSQRAALPTAHDDLPARESVTQVLKANRPDPPGSGRAAGTRKEEGKKRPVVAQRVMMVNAPTWPREDDTPEAEVDKAEEEQGVRQEDEEEQTVPLSSQARRRLMARAAAKTAPSSDPPASLRPTSEPSPKTENRAPIDASEQPAPVIHGSPRARQPAVRTKLPRPPWALALGAALALAVALVLAFALAPGVQGGDETTDAKCPAEPTSLEACFPCAPADQGRCMRAFDTHTAAP